MSEIVVGSWVQLVYTDYTHAGVVVEIRRQAGTPSSTDLVRFVDGHGVVHEAGRGALNIVDVPDSEGDALAQEIAQLKDEVAALEAEMERRDRVAREKYAALERDRDNVERIMREASGRADQYERDLKVVLEREAARLKKAGERADMWQSAAADALAQIKALREAAK